MIAFTYAIMQAMKLKKSAQNMYSKTAIVSILIVATILGSGINSSSKSTDISPCILPLPVPCNEVYDKMRINYTQRTYGYPAAYKQTAVSEQIQPQPFMSTSYDPIPFSLLTLLSNIVFWSVLLGLGLQLFRKYR